MGNDLLETYQQLPPDPKTKPSAIMTIIRTVEIHNQRQTLMTTNKLASR